MSMPTMPSETTVENNYRSVFAYWDDDDQSPIAEFAAEWRCAFPSFRILGNQDAIPILESYSPRHIDLYRSIQFPAARSDVARLLLLYEFGGLYVDCHFGIRDRQGILDKLLLLDNKFDLIVVDRARVIAARPDDEYYFINGVIFARAKCPLVLMCALQALANLETHRAIERLLGSVSYHVSTLSGPGVLNATLLDPRYIARSLRTRIRPDFASRIAIIKEEDAPMTRNVHGAYRKAGQHWSERQQNENLFKI